MTGRRPRARVVITGLGAVSAAGADVGALWTALTEPRACLTALARFDPGRPAVAGQVSAYPGPPGVPAHFLKRLDRAAQMGLDAGMQAVADAGTALRAEEAPAFAAISGVAHGPVARGESGWALLGSGLAGATIGLHIAGPAFTIAADGASGLHALATAAQLIRAGSVQAALAVGAEAPLAPQIWAAYDEAGLLSRRAEANAQRPFDRRRDGLVLGEGAGALLLEERGRAIARGATIYAEVAGLGQSSGPPGDGQPPTDVEIARQALDLALLDAGGDPHVVDAVIAAGTGAPQGDQREAAALARCFGARLQDVYVTSVTPSVGYTVGAAGVLAALAGVLALQAQILPAHASYEERDPACPLDIATSAQDERLQGVLACAYGGMGQNAAVLLVEHEE